MQAIVTFGFTYLMLCAIAAMFAGYERRIGFAAAMVVCTLFTPLMGILICMLFPPLPKACCMKDYMDFSTGTCYRFKKKTRNGKLLYYVQHASSHPFSQADFHKYFSIVVKDRAHVSDAIAELGDRV